MPSSQRQEVQLRMLELGDEAAFRAAVQAFYTSDPDWEFAFHFDEGADFAAYVRRLEAWSRGEQLPDGFVPNTYLVAVCGTALVGRISIRHRLNDFLERVGGHIGYGVVPAQRRRGYGKQILEQGLSVARGLGLRRVLLTCDDDNEASCKIIEANRGALERIERTPGLQPKRRYWIEL